jgi:hypothetical protein
VGALASCPPPTLPPGGRPPSRPPVPGAGDRGGLILFLCGVAYALGLGSWVLFCVGSRMRWVLYRGFLCVVGCWVLYRGFLCRCLVSWVLFCRLAYALGLVSF